MGLTADQLAIRKGRVTASLVPHILNLVPASQERQDKNEVGPGYAYNEILGMSRRKETPAMRLGSGFEFTIAKEWALVNGRQLVKAKTLLMDEWAGATSDFWLTGPDVKRVLRREITEILEVKAVLSDYARPDWFDGLPLRVQAQAAWQIIVARANGMPVERCRVAAFIGGEVHPFVVERDPDGERDLITVCRHFFVEHVQKRIPPKDVEPPHPSEVSGTIKPTKGTVRTLEPGCGADILGRELLALSEHKKPLTAEIKQIDAEERRLKAMLQDEFGTSETIQGTGWQLTRGEVKGQVDWAEVARSLYRPEDEGRFAELVRTNTAPTTERLYFKVK